MSKQSSSKLFIPVYLKETTSSNKTRRNINSQTAATKQPTNSYKQQTSGTKRREERGSRTADSKTVATLTATATSEEIGCGPQLQRILIPPTAARISEEQRKLTPYYTESSRSYRETSDVPGEKMDGSQPQRILIPAKVLTSSCRHFGRKLSTLST
ncbi:hypothetical protein EUGRSUZ_E02166 [Eucalyptus grandis]|uniref:Uncharacterized protein n=2 Tax=Eucalyptus grandis TaxID=71139 RepID=A0ACC3KX33_EUCGR|nr:hypothetical protein EUGRSUZ_E02166 [Eucalyptus grandis]